MKAVLDTNVFLSGIHWVGASHEVLREWFKGTFVLVSSPQINEELFAQFRDFKIQMPMEEILWWESLIMEKSILVMPKRKINLIKKDSDDNKFIEVAIESNADYIVTQDKHLLEIREYKGIKILTPQEFLELIVDG